MALPKINDTPKYNVTIPSTGKRTRFRPFLVKEEKVLLLAMESQDKNQIIASIADTIEACVDDVKVNSMTSFDIEYLFIKLRSKAVGETSNIIFKCKECEAENEVSIEFDKIKVPKPKNNTKIKLSDDITLEMKYPTYNDLLGVDEDLSQTDQLFNLIKMCMKTLHTEDERIDLKDESDQELTDFIESMNSGHLKQITDFIDAMPKLEYDTKFDCIKCKHTNSEKITRFEDFFV